MARARIFAVLLLLAGIALGYFTYATEKSGGRFAFKLGLDLQGGSHLIYRAHTEKLTPDEVGPSMDSLRDVIERRVNLFGVSEPLVQVEKGRGEGGGTENRLIVELPGVTDLDEAIELIGVTPTLEFKIARVVPGTASTSESQVVYDPTPLTGRFLQKAVLQFDPQTGAPLVSLEFNSEGSELFAQITRDNVGKILAIFLDNSPISEPVISEEITGGKAVITGTFSPSEGKILVGRLNAGALPVAIELISTEKIGASLGGDTVNRSLRAGLWGLLLVAIFMILWYRLPGLVAALALVFYVLLNLALFKLIGVTLTAAGIAGLILSIGMAVDGNILIFERLKEELKNGKTLKDAIHDGFARAWAAIWDGNITAIVSALILFWFGTSLIEGFALTFGIGVVLSMFSSITISRTLLYAIAPKNTSQAVKKLFSSGLTS